MRLEVGTTAVRMLRHSRLCWSVLFAVMPLAQTGLAQEIPGLACIVGVNGNTGPVYNLHKLSDGAVLIVAQKGWFLAREANDTVAVAPAKDNTETHPRADEPTTFVGPRDGGTVPRLYDLRGGGTLIGDSFGLFLARRANGKLSVVQLHLDPLYTTYLPGVSFPRAFFGIGAVKGLHGLPGGSVLVGTSNGLFLAGEANGMLTVAPLYPQGVRPSWQMQRVNGFHEFPSGAVLIGGEASVEGRMEGISGLPKTLENRFPLGADGLLLAREANGLARPSPDWNGHEPARPSGRGGPDPSCERMVPGPGGGERQGHSSACGRGRHRSRLRAA